MNIKRFYLRFLHRRLNKKVQNPPATSTAREFCAEVLRSLNTDQFAMYHPGQALGQSVKAPYARLDELTIVLRSFNSNIRLNHTLRVPDFESMIREVPVEKFFITTGGYYQDVEQAIIRFKKEVLELCEQLEPTDEAEYGLAEWRRRVFEKLFVNLTELTNKLIEVSLTD